MTRVALERRKVAEIPGVGELVEVDDRLGARREPIEDEVGADEAGASGDQNHRSGFLIEGREFYHAERAGPPRP